MDQVTRRFACWSVGLAFTMGALSCATSYGSLPTAQQLSERAIENNIDPDSLREGRSLAVTECAECHRFYWPNEYSPDEWPPIIRKMGRRASFDDAEIQSLIDYYTMASQTKTK